MSDKFPFKVGDKVRYTGVDGWHEEGETLVVSFSEQPDGGHTWCVNDDYRLDIISVCWEDFELVETAPEKHIHYDMIVEWAANPSRVVQYPDVISGKEFWYDCPNQPAWNPETRYRFKPEEPERVFPTTSLTDEELSSTFNTTGGWNMLDDGLKAVANAAIKRYILELEETS